jgi:hypothetical protein
MDEFDSVLLMSEAVLSDKARQKLVHYDVTDEVSIQYMDEVTLQSI